MELIWILHFGRFQLELQYPFVVPLYPHMSTFYQPIIIYRREYFLLITLKGFNIWISHVYGMKKSGVN